MFFADDFVLVDEIRECVNLKLEIWGNNLDAKGLKLSRVKTEYLKCNFNNKVNRSMRQANINNIEIGRNKIFQYLGSIT